MFYLPFAIGSLLFALTTATISNVIIPDNMIIEILSGFAVVMNTINLLVEAWNYKHGVKRLRNIDPNKMPKWEYCLRFAMMFLFMFSEIASVFLLMSLMLWSMYAPEVYLSSLLAALLILITFTIVLLCLKYLHNYKLKHIVGCIATVADVFALISIVFIVIKG